MQSNPFQINFSKAIDLLVKNPDADISREMLAAEEFLEMNSDFLSDWRELTMELYKRFPTCGYGVNMNFVMADILAGGFKLVSSLLFRWEEFVDLNSIGVIGKKILLIESRLNYPAQASIFYRIASHLVIRDWRTSDVLRRLAMRLEPDIKEPDPMYHDRNAFGKSLVVFPSQEREFWHRVFNNEVTLEEWGNFISKQFLEHFTKKVNLTHERVCILELYIPKQVMKRVYSKFLNTKGSVTVGAARAVQLTSSEQEPDKGKGPPPLPSNGVFLPIPDETISSESYLPAPVVIEKGGVDVTLSMPVPSKVKLIPKPLPSSSGSLTPTSSSQSRPKSTPPPPSGGQVVKLAPALTAPKPTPIGEVSTIVNLALQPPAAVPLSSITITEDVPVPDSLQNGSISYQDFASPDKVVPTSGFHRISFGKIGFWFAIASVAVALTHCVGYRMKMNSDKEQIRKIFE